MESGYRQKKGAVATAVEYNEGGKKMKSNCPLEAFISPFTCFIWLCAICTIVNYDLIHSPDFSHIFSFVFK